MINMLSSFFLDLLSVCHPLSLSAILIDEHLHVFVFFICFSIYMLWCSSINVKATGHPPYKYTLELYLIHHRIACLSLNVIDKML